MFEIIKIETKESGQRRIIFPWLKFAVFITPRKSGTAPDKSGKIKKSGKQKSKQIRMVEEKICWMCKRTESELKNWEFDKSFEQETWFECAQWSTVFLCPVCRQIIFELTQNER